LDYRCFALGNLVPAQIQLQYWDLAQWPNSISQLKESKKWITRRGTEKVVAPLAAFQEARKNVKVHFFLLNGGHENKSKSEEKRKQNKTNKTKQTDTDLTTKLCDLQKLQGGLH